MHIDLDVQKVLDYLASRPVINAAAATLDELRRYKEEIEYKYDLPWISMHLEREMDIPVRNGSVPVRVIDTICQDSP